MSAFSIATFWFAAATLLCTPPTVRPQVPYSADFCSAASDVKRFSMIREDILSKLNMHLPYNITSQWWSHDRVQNTSRNVDQALVKAYEAVSRALAEEDSTEPTGCAKAGRGRGTPAFAKRISLFFPVESSVVYMPSEAPAHGEQDVDTALNVTTIPIRYTFVFKPSLPSQQLYSAELRLFTKRASTCVDMIFQNVEIFLVLRKDKEEERLLVTSKNVEIDEDIYESFNILQAVNKWIENANNNSLELEILLNCPISTKTGSFSPPSVEFVTNNSTSHLSDDIEETRPQLVVATVTEEVATKLGKKRRRRRQVVATEYCNHNPNTVHCCIRDLVLNFHTDLNLPFIVYPYTFKPNFCRGLCPVPYLESNIIRMSIQQYYQTNDLGGGPCCTIYSMDPLLMVIQDVTTGTVVMKDVPDMEITSCGCVD